MHGFISKRGRRNDTIYDINQIGVWLLFSQLLKLSWHAGIVGKSSYNLSFRREYLMHCNNTASEWGLNQTISAS